MSDQDIETWQAVLAEFNPSIPEYKNPQKGKSQFVPYIMNALNKYQKESEIFVCYLVQPDTQGDISAARLDKFRGPDNPHGYDGTLAKIAESSAEGKFLFHPNYVVV